MRRSLLQRVWFGCLHRFSWPRRSDDGNYYQVCLECGVRYRYDWRGMRRTARLDENETGETAVALKPLRKSGGNNTWRPRERRLSIDVPVQFRRKGAREWRAGQAQNISRSGLLFTTDGETPPPGSPLEVEFLMPAEICGDAPADVLCQACVVRVHEATRNQGATVAAAISDFVYRSQRKAG